MRAGADPPAGYKAAAPPRRGPFSELEKRLNAKCENEWHHIRGWTQQLAQGSFVIVERKIPVEPQDVEHFSVPKANHWFIAREAKCDDIGVLRDARWNASLNAMAGDYFAALALPRSDGYLLPCTLAKLVETVCKRRFILRLTFTETK